MVRTTLITTLLAALPLVAGAQQRARPQRPAQPPPQAGRAFRDPAATQLLNRRRELDLTPRQVARLDSIERVQFARQRSMATDLRRLRDSACGSGRRCTVEERQALRDRVLQLRERGIDTTLRRLAMSILDSTQRGRVQGWQMQGRRAMAQRMRRGFQQGRMGTRGQMGPRFRDQVGPGGRVVPRGGAGPRGGFGPGRGNGRGFDGPRLRERMGPGIEGRRPFPMRQRRPGDELEAPPTPPDTTR